MFFFSSRRRHTRLQGDWSSDVCSSDLCLGWEIMTSCKSVGAPNTAVAFTGNFLLIAMKVMIPPRDSPYMNRLFISTNPSDFRSEERRVGKECRYQWWR